MEKLKNRLISWFKLDEWDYEDDEDLESLRSQLKRFEGSLQPFNLRSFDKFNQISSQSVEEAASAPFDHSKMSKGSISGQYSLFRPAQSVLRGKQKSIASTK